MSPETSSSDLIIPPSAAKLARKAWMHITGLLLLGLLGAVALAFYGYQIHRLSAAVVSYREAEAEYTSRTLAIDILSNMQTAFNRFLLDGNSANLDLIQRDRKMIEQMAQSSKDDQFLQNLASTEQKWNDQVAQPLIEARKKLSVNQGLPEDLLAKYRAPGQDLDVSAFAIPTESKYVSAREALLGAEFQMRWLWVPIPLAVLLLVGTLALGVQSMKSVNHLKQLAEDAGEEDEDQNVPDNHEETK